MNVLKEIPFDEVELGERFRQDLGDIAGLEYTISKHGLLHPITVLKYKTPSPEGKQYIVACGGRRFLAIQSLAKKENRNTFIASVRDYIDEYDLRMLELIENAYRKDISPYERCELDRRILKLEQEKKGVKTHSSSKAGIGITDVAATLNRSEASVRQNIKRAEIMAAMPPEAQALFRNAKSTADIDRLIKEADKIISKKEGEHKARKLYSEDKDEKKQSIITSYQVKDVFVGLAEHPDNSFDFIECDPPYGIDIIGLRQKHHAAGLSGVDNLYQEVSKEDYPKFLDKLIKELTRIAKPNCWFICWASWQHYSLLEKKLQENNWHLPHTPGIWVKTGSGGQLLNLEYTLASNHEPFFYARKGAAAKVQKPATSNVFSFNRVPGQKKIHPTERPAELIASLLETFCLPGQNALVPFAGSGRTLLECAKFGMSVVGFDLVQEYKDAFILKVFEEIL